MRRYGRKRRVSTKRRRPAGGKRTRKLITKIAKAVVAKNTRNMHVNGVYGVLVCPQVFSILSYFAPQEFFVSTGTPVNYGVNRRTENIRITSIKWNIPLVTPGGVKETYRFMLVRFKNSNNSQFNPNQILESNIAGDSVGSVLESNSIYQVLQDRRFTVNNLAGLVAERTWINLRYKSKAGKEVIFAESSVLSTPPFVDSGLLGWFYCCDNGLGALGGNTYQVKAFEAPVNG